MVLLFDYRCALPLWVACDRLGVTLSGCVGVCVGVCVACVREKAKSNKLAEMVPSELHD